MTTGKYLTVGIAGHVDHGKTTLVRHLTGVDTDRMKEEKRRGLSMVSGVAPLLLPSGARIGLIDVPGHTDFIKNTLRGLSAVDAAVLIVAADDGVMPQTREHLWLLRYLGVRSGFIVLGKTDLVDRETAEFASLEIQELVKNTFLEGSPILPFSGLDGRGLAGITAALEAIAEKTPPGKETGRPFRLFIDQIRMFKGFGTVVSGTVLSGSVRKGDRVVLLPAGDALRVRSIETHHDAVEAAETGFRVGMSLQGALSKGISRGMVLAEPGSLTGATMLNVELHVTPETQQALKTGTRIRVCLGTVLTVALAVVIEGEEIPPGGTGLAQLRLAEPLGALPLDRFVILPMNIHRILGGGRVLETTAVKFRRARGDRAVPVLKALQSGDAGRVISARLWAYPERTLLPADLARLTGAPCGVFERELEKGVSEGRLVRISEGLYGSAVHAAKVKDSLPGIVDGALGNDIVKECETSAAIAPMLENLVDPLLLERLLGELVREGKLAAWKRGFATPAFLQRQTALRGVVGRKISAALEECGIVPATLHGILDRFRGVWNREEILAVLGFLVQRGDVVPLSNERYLSARAMDQIKERVREQIEKHGSMTPRDCGDVLGYGRMIGLPILEYLDSVGFTVREGNERFLKG
jgi:selenocysteine-specific elongation factor